MLERSAISDIFRGQVAYLLECPGQKDSLTLQPFITVQLDVQHQSVTSAQEALRRFVAREAVTNYTNSSKIKVDATKRTLFDVLPKVLVLHFKWFKYDAKGGLLKNTKQFYLDECLEIQDDLMTPHSSRRMAAHMKKYELFAVVTHIGSQAVGGHYYTDAFHKGYMQWLRYDDEKIHKVCFLWDGGFIVCLVGWLIDRLFV
ncbi:hypothetical protein HELRODRAFT_92156 [Helobdella robusta]|uniref:ubiquitinyl hydrolase 1 n=1 Tax=Helobdella robusta TaxID=6412 RepID=T1G8C5_HELRO|nr:hypothetical protein HELRODRAFT_92156 [Helobdella robusta]ESO09737.1 hypothetical protein HELRODRAFT_92156 [Helobdella robusta]